MNISDNTLDILKNFSTINQSIVFDKGNVIQTCSPTKTVLAKAKVNDKFPQKFAIYDLNRFLGTIGMFEKPDYEFEENSVLVKNGVSEVRYGFADASLVISPPEKGITMPEAEIEFEMSEKQFAAVIKAAGVLQMPEVAVEGDGEKIYLTTLDVNNTSSDKFKIEVGETDAVFRMVFKFENLKFIPMAYDVSITSKGIAHFKGTDIEYWVATEASSSYGEK